MTWKLITASAFLAASMVTNVMAADVKAECEAGLDRDGAPPAVKAGCACIESETAGNETLQAEFIRISQLPQTERTSIDSPDVMALMQKCFTNPQ